MEYVDLKVPTEILTPLVTTINESNYRIKLYYHYIRYSASYQIKLCNVQEIVIYNVLTNQKIITMINDEHRIINEFYLIDYELLKKLNFEVEKEFGYLNIYL